MISKKKVYALAKKKNKEVVEEGDVLIIKDVHHYEAYSCDSDSDFSLLFTFDKNGQCIDIDIDES